MASTTIETETELSAVNSILGAIGQSPVTTLGEMSDGTTTYANPEIAFIYNLLRDTNVDVQNEGWHFNKEEHVSFSPDSTTKKISVSDDIIKIDTHDGWSNYTYNIIKRDGFLYDKEDHTYEFDDDLICDVVRLYEFSQIPSPFQRYIIYKAAVRAATQLMNNANLAKLLSSQEIQARATCLEYECNQGNHSYLGLETKSIYNTYKPHRGLRR